jgi:hypothetical protein
VYNSFKIIPGIESINLPYGHSRMADNLSSSLLNLLLKPEPSLKSVVALFAQYIGADHYVLLEAPVGNSPPFAVVSDFLQNPVLPAGLFEAANPPRNQTFDPAIEFAGVSEVRRILSITVADGLFLIFVNGKLLDFPESIVGAVRRVYEGFPFDVESAVAAVEGYGEEDMKPFKRRSFSVKQWHPSQLFLYTVGYFVESGVCKKAGVSNTAVFKFLASVRAHYNDVPYHNWMHALDAAQFVYSLHCQARIDRFLNDLEVFALFVATVCHDTDHNGFNNNFHRNAKTQFAHLAPNLPPLEHHHCCISCDLLPPLLADLNEVDRGIVTHFMIDCIMATDMEQHKKFLEAWVAISGTFDRTNAAHRLLLGQIIMKAADLSNVVRDFDEAARMSGILVTETQRQGRREIELGLPISPMCDPNDKTPLCVGQIGFYGFVAGPLMRQLGAFFPEVDDNLRQFEQNLETWKAMKADWEAKKG